MNFTQKLPVLTLAVIFLITFQCLSQISSQSTAPSSVSIDSLVRSIDEIQISKSKKIDSSSYQKLSQATRLLLIKGAAIHTDLLSIRSELGQTENILKASELYLAIQADEMATKSIADLKKSIRKRAYISMGIGLASSALFFIGNNGSGGNSKSTRNIGAVVSLSIPIVSLLTMNKQLKSIKVPPTYDKEIFQNQRLLVDVHSINFNKNYIKTELYLLKKLIGNIDNNNAANLLKLKNTTIPKEIRQCAITSLSISDQLAYVSFQVEKLNGLLKDPQFLIGFDQSAISKFKVLEKELDKFTQSWNVYSAKLNLINRKIENFTLCTHPYEAALPEE